MASSRAPPLPLPRPHPPPPPQEPRFVESPQGPAAPAPPAPRRPPLAPGGAGVGAVGVTVSFDGGDSWATSAAHYYYFDASAPPVASALAPLAALQTLWLQENSLSGTLPPQLVNGTVPPNATSFGGALSELCTHRI